MQHDYWIPLALRLANTSIAVGIPSCEVLYLGRNFIHDWLRKRGTSACAQIRCQEVGKTGFSVESNE